MILLMINDYGRWNHLHCISCRVVREVWGAGGLSHASRHKTETTARRLKTDVGAKSTHAHAPRDVMKF